MFSRKECKNGRAHATGKQYGAQAMDAKQHKGRKSVTKWTQAQFFHKRADSREYRPKDLTPMSEEEKMWFPDVWAEMLKEMNIPVRELEQDVKPKRQSPEIEAAVCRQMRIYRKCSRNCKPRAFGGCKGWTRWGSCPTPEPKSEE